MTDEPATGGPLPDLSSHDDGPAPLTLPGFTIPRAMLETNPADIITQLTPDDGGVYGQMARVGAAVHNVLHPDNPVKTVREWEAEDAQNGA